MSLGEQRENGKNMSKKGSKSDPKMTQNGRNRPLFYTLFFKSSLEKGWKWQKSGQKVQKKWKKVKKRAKKVVIFRFRKIKSAKNAKKCTFFCMGKISQKEKKRCFLRKKRKKMTKNWQKKGQKMVKKRQKMAKNGHFLGYPKNH